MASSWNFSGVLSGVALSKRRRSLPSSHAARRSAHSATYAGPFERSSERWIKTRSRRLRSAGGMGTGVSSMTSSATSSPRASSCRAIS
jgi:hypothetical protein